MKTKLTTLLACFMVMTICSNAQIKISGKTFDKANEAIHFANIALLKSDSTFIAGASSDLSGFFAFNDVAIGNYIVSVTFVGLDKKYLAVNADQNVDLGTIILDDSDIHLSEVVVTGHSVIQKSDRKIIIPSQTQLKASNSGITLLRNLQLSRIIVNPLANAVTTPSGDAVQLRINGRLVTNNDILALQPEDVIRIEYHDDPGLRYGDAGAVIDYIVRRKDSGGNISTNLSNAPFDIGFAEDNLSAKFNNKKSEFALNSHFHYRKIDWTRENNESFVFPNKTLDRYENGVPTQFNEKSLQSSLSYSLHEPDQYLFNATFRNTYYDTPNSYTDRQGTGYTSEDSTPYEIYEHGTEKSNSPSLDLYFQRNLKNEQLLILNVVGTYIDTKTTRNYKQQSDPNPFDIYSNIKGDKYSLIAEGIYEKGFKQGKLSTGIKHTQSYTNNTYAGDISRDVAMKFAETYAYAEYQWRKDKLSVAGGLGVMRIYNSQGGQSRQKYILRPSARISYNISDNAYIRYNASMSGYSPSLSDLNDVIQKIDSFQIRKGNPNLRSVVYHTHNINAGYNKGIFGVELYARYNYDKGPIMEQITFEDDKFVRMKANHKGFHRFTSSATFRLKPFKEYVNLSFSPGINRFISYGNNYTHTYTGYPMRGSLLLTYKEWAFGFEFNSRWNSFWGETINYNERIHLINIGYKQPKWSCGIMVLKPFDKNYMQAARSFSKLNPGKSEVFSDNLGQMVVFNFSMNLNFGRQHQAGNKRLNNDDKDAGIMK